MEQFWCSDMSLIQMVNITMILYIICIVSLTVIKKTKTLQCIFYMWIIRFQCHTYIVSIALLHNIYKTYIVCFYNFLYVRRNIYYIAIGLSFNSFHDYHGKNNNQEIFLNFFSKHISFGYLKCIIIH